MHTHAGRSPFGVIVWGIVFVLLISIPACCCSIRYSTCCQRPGGLSQLQRGKSAVQPLMHPGTETPALSTATYSGSEQCGCVKALVLDGNANYVSIPYTSQNHPADAITVSLWFYVNEYGTPDTALDIR